MNKKGQKIFLGVMVAIMLFIALVVLLSPLKGTVETARSEDYLNCTDPNLSTGVAATCILVDFYIFYFFGAGIAASIAFMVGRKL